MEINLKFEVTDEDMIKFANQFGDQQYPQPGQEKLRAIICSVYYEGEKKIASHIKEMMEGYNKLDIMSMGLTDISINHEEQAETQE